MTEHCGRLLPWWLVPLALVAGVPLALAEVAGVPLAPWLRVHRLLAACAVLSHVDWRAGTANGPSTEVGSWAELASGQQLLAAALAQLAAALPLSLAQQMWVAVAQLASALTLVFAVGTAPQAEPWPRPRPMAGRWPRPMTDR